MADLASSVPAPPVVASCVEKENYERRDAKPVSPKRKPLGVLENISTDRPVPLTGRLAEEPADSPDRTLILNAFTPEMGTVKSEQTSGRSSVSSTTSLQESHGSPARPSSAERKEGPRKRRRTSPDELQILEYEFARNSRPCKEERERIASLTSKDEKAVQVWFQNKRQSCRRQQNGTGMIPALVRSISYTDDVLMPNGQVMPAIPTHSFPGPAPSRSGSQSNPLGQSVAYYPGYPSLSPPYAAQKSPAESTPSRVPAPPAQAQPTQVDENNIIVAKRSKSLKLSMSADGKAEIVERSPLKVLSNRMPAHRSQTTPSVPSGFEQECASSLLVLKSGHW